MKKNLLLFFVLLLPIFLFSQKSGIYCLQFDGDDSVEISDDNTLDNSSRFTIEFWVKPTNLDGSPQGVVSKRVNYDDNNSYGIFFYNNDNIYVDIDSTNDRFNSNKIFTNNNWYYVAVVYDGTLTSSQRVKLYVADEGDTSITLDKTASETSTALPNTASNLYIGQLHGNTPAYGSMEGYVDEVRL